MKRTFVAVLALVALTLPLAADEPPPFTTSTEVGMAAGLVSGVGLSVRQWFGPVGVQATVGSLTQQSWPESWVRTYYDWGVNALITWQDWRHSRLYSYGGLAQWGIFPAEVGENFVSLGGGFGVEMVLADRIAFNIQAGMALGSSEGRGLPGPISVYFPTGEVALYYRLGGER